MGNAKPCGKLCDNCGSDFVFLTTRDIYSHRQSSGWTVIYYCGDCTASVGTHPDTTEPLGRMATAKTRYLRAKAHAAFDPIWRCGFMTRDGAIRWAAKEMMVLDELHISTLSDDQLLTLTKLSKQYLASKQRYNLEVLEARTEERKMRDAKQLSDNNARYAAKRRKKR